MNAKLILGLLALSPLSITALHAKGTDIVAAAASIDSILAKDWAQHKLTGNPMSDDHTFVRRIYLDIIGRIPTTKETEEFLADKATDRRAKLIDQLLASDGYVQHSFNYWADVLRMNQGNATGAAYNGFIKTSLRENKPYNKMVAEMISAQGRPWENGAIGYYTRDQNMPLDNMANTVRIFLGTRIECAQCHNHPFDKWSQMQFYQMAAFTYGVQSQQYGGTVAGVSKLINQQQSEMRATFSQGALKDPPRPKRTKEMTEEQFTALQADYKAKMGVIQIERDKLQKQLRGEQRNFQEAMNELRNNVRDGAIGYDENRKVSLPKEYQYPDAAPRSKVASETMFGHECQTQPGETALQAYARWMTSKDNPRFTSVIASRLWKRAFGLALIEPLDELLDTSVPMIPELQTHLEQMMRDLDYDMRAYQRVLFNTKAYQRQVSREEVPPGVVYHFTGPLLRRMSAEQMWDSFVTLINPNPDMPNQLARETMQQLVLQAKKSVDAINTLKPEEIMVGVTKAANLYKGQADAIGKLQVTLSVATTKLQELEKEAKKLTGDEQVKAREAAIAAKEEVTKLRRSLGALSRDARMAVQNDVLLPSKKRLYEQVTGKPFQSAMLQASTGTPSSNSGDSMMMMSSAANERVLIPGYDPVVLTPEEKKAAEQKRHTAYAVEADYYGIATKDRPNYYRSRDDQSRSWLRAAEISSPAPRGHYLREFGQSDRETIENANHDASVPQALAMMNGALLPQIVGKFSQLMLTVSKAPYPDDKIEAIYMTLLSRKPTTKERDTWLQAQSSGLTTFEDLIFSLLNTQQFIFVQ